MFIEISQTCSFANDNFQTLQKSFAVGSFSVTSQKVKMGIMKCDFSSHFEFNANFYRGKTFLIFSFLFFFLSKTIVGKML